MAAVPAPTGFTVAPAAGLNARVPDAPVDNRMGQQLAAAGGAIADASAHLNAIQLDAQRRANEARVNDALNAVKEKALDLTYGPQDGFTNIKGGDALNRPDGKSLFDEYGTKLDESVSSVAQGLNPEQQRMFSQGVAQIRQSYDGALMQHFNQEARTFELSTNGSVIETAQREIALAAGDPNVVGSASERIKMASISSMKLIGKSDAEGNDQARKFISEAHTMSIAGMLDRNETATATQYLTEHRSDMEADDIIRIEAKLEDANRITGVTSFVGDMLSSTGPAGASTDFDKLTTAVLGAEGGGTLANPKTSPKGAKGPMQVMDGTNLDPGYGVTPAKDNSQAERARVGRDYLAAMVKHYGTRTGVAAYNAGPGAVDAALKKADGGDPLPFLPRETQKYTDRIMAQIGGADTGEPRMSLSAGLAMIRNRFADDPRAMSEAERQFTSGYSAMLADKNRNEQDAVDGTMRSIYNNGGQLTPALAAKVPAKYLDSLQSFAHQVAEARANPANSGESTLVWAGAKEGIANGSITSQDQLLRLSPKLTTSDYRDLVGDLAAISAGDAKRTDSYKTLGDTLKFIHGEMASAGLDFSPDSKDKDAAAKYAQFTGQLFKQISAIEGIRGKPLEPAEARQVALKLLAEVPQTGGWFSSPKRGYELANPALPLSSIPADVRQGVESRLRAARIPVNEHNIRSTLR